MVIPNLDERKTLNELEKKIICAIVERKIPAISYYHPEVQLGNMAETGKIQEALYSLEHTFNALKLNPSLKFKFHSFLPTKCGYNPCMDVITKLYNNAE